MSAFGRGQSLNAFEQALRQVTDRLGQFGKATERTAKATAKAESETTKALKSVARGAVLGAAAVVTKAATQQLRAGLSGGAAPTSILGQGGSLATLSRSISETLGLDDANPNARAAKRTEAFLTNFATQFAAATGEAPGQELLTDLFRKRLRTFEAPVASAEEAVKQASLPFRNRVSTVNQLVRDIGDFAGLDSFVDSERAAKDRNRNVRGGGAGR